MNEMVNRMKQCRILKNITENGMVYDREIGESLRGINGVTFTLFREQHHKKWHIRMARQWLRKKEQMPVVAIYVACV